MKKYYPYVSDKPNKKYFIITNTGKRVYFGAAGYEDFTTTPISKGVDAIDV